MLDDVKTAQSETKYKTFITFSIVGTVGLAVEVSCVAFFYEFFGLSALFSKALAFPIAVLVTWILNRNLTFRKRANSGLLNELFRYLNVTLIGALVNNSVYILIINFFDGDLLTAIFAVAAGSVSGLTTNFLGLNRYVFIMKSPKE